MKRILIVSCILIVFGVLVAIVVNEIQKESDIPCVASEGYFKKNSGIYYRPRGHLKGDEWEIKVADYKSFEIIDSRNAKDKNIFYHEGKVVDGGNVETMTVLHHPYLKDQNQVFYYGEPMQNVDVKSFGTITQHYAKDKNNVYFGDEIILETNPKNFMVKSDNSDCAYDENHSYFKGKKLDKEKMFINDNYFRDQCFIFYGRTRRMPEANVMSFEVLPEKQGCRSSNHHPPYAKDQNQVYMYDRVVLDADPKSFESIEYTNFYARDKNHVFYSGKKIEGSDGQSFITIRPELVDGYADIAYSKDKNFVYVVDGFPLKKADPQSFEYLGDGYAKDKDYIFYLHNVLGKNTGNYKNLGNRYFILEARVLHDGVFMGSHIDATTFSLLGYGQLTGGITKDKNHVYFDDKIFDEADAETFKIIDEDFAKDKNDVFRLNGKGNIIWEEVDAESFEIDKGFAKDINNVYYIDADPDITLENVDVSTFQVLENGFVKDKNHVYKNGEILEGADPASFKVPEN